MGAVGAKPSVASFDPLSMGWHTFVRGSSLSGSNGDPITAWNDESGNGRNLTQATSSRRPVYRPTIAALNNQPGAEFDGVDDVIQSAAFTQVPQTYSVVIVAAINGTIANNVYILNVRNSVGGGLRTITGTNRYSAFFGGVFDTTHVADTSGHLVHARASGATSKVGKDGTEQTGNAGTSNADAFGIGAFSAGTAHAALSATCAGLFVGDITAHASWANFKAWVASTYGLTIA